MIRLTLTPSRLKPFGRLVALLTLLVISAILLPEDTAISSSSSTVDTHSTASLPADQEINAAEPSKISGSVTPGDGSTPPAYCTDVEVESTGTGWLGFFPWGAVTVSISPGVPPGSYKFWAGPGYECNRQNTLYCWSPLVEGMTCVSGQGGSVCSGTFDIKLYANKGNFSGHVYKLPQETLVNGGGVNAGGYHTPIDASGYYNFALFNFSDEWVHSNNWGVQLLCDNSRYNLGTAFDLTAYVTGLTSASTRAVILAESAGE